MSIPFLDITPCSFALQTKRLTSCRSDMFEELSPKPCENVEFIVEPRRENNDNRFSYFVT